MIFDDDDFDDDVNNGERGKKVYVPINEYVLQGVPPWLQYKLDTQACVDKVKKQGILPYDTVY